MRDHVTSTDEDELWEKPCLCLSPNWSESGHEVVAWVIHVSAWFCFLCKACVRVGLDQ